LYSSTEIGAPVLNLSCRTAVVHKDWCGPRQHIVGVKVADGEVLGGSGGGVEPEGDDLGVAGGGLEGVAEVQAGGLGPGVGGDIQNG
jgi:hypothetical protein